MTLDKLISNARFIDYKGTSLSYSDNICRLYKEWESLPNYKKIGYISLFMFEKNDITYYLNKSSQGWNINKKDKDKLTTYQFHKKGFFSESKNNITSDFFLCLDVLDEELK